MSNIPENENITELEQKIALTDEESTVFSNPIEHTKTADTVKKKRILPKILASVLAVAILAGGTVAVIKLIPEKEEPKPQIVETIQVLSLTTDELKTVKVTNSEGEFEFYREIVKNDKNEDVEGNWFLKGYDTDVLNTTNISYPVATAASVSATREITEKNIAECGLDKPQIVIDLLTKEEKAITILIGVQSPDKSGYYAKLSDSDKIYLVENEFYESFVFNELVFASTNPLPTFDSEDSTLSKYFDQNGNLVSFDKLTISGKNFPEPVVLSVNSDERFVSYATYVVTSPVTRIAENVDGIMSLFQITSSTAGAYSYDVSEKSKAAFGLNNPDIVLKVEVSGKSKTYSFKLQEDGNYAVIYDGAKLISVLEASKLSFANYSASDFYSTWVALVSIDDISSFTFKAGDKEYKFDITANETDEESDEEQEKYTIVYNSNKLAASDFQSFYQECISIACTDYTVDKVSGAPDYSMIFEYKEDGEKTVVDFIKSSETRYQYRINGKDMGKVNSSGIKKLYDSLKKLVKE